jgi:hypothetical protein
MTDTTFDQPDAPLTFGQMSVWRDIDRLPRARWHEANLANTFTLPEPVSRRQLCQALTHLDAKHESVRMLYDVADPQHPRQRLLPPRPVTDVEVVDGQRADEAIDALLARPIDLTRERPLRVLAIADSRNEPSHADSEQARSGQSGDPDAAELTRIVLCLHHIAADGWSLGLLWTDLLWTMGIGGEELPDAPTSLLDLAREQRTSSSWAVKLKATQRHFRTVLQTPATDFRDRDRDAGVLQAAVETATLAGAVQELADAHKVSPATVFTAGYLDAIAGYCDPGLIRIGLMTSNRFLQRWRHQVTTMNQLIPITVAADPEIPFAERLQPIQLATMRAYRIGMYDVDQVTPAALGIPPEVAQLGYVCTFNLMDMANAEYPSPDGATLDDPPVHWEPVFNQIAAGCYLRVYLTTTGTVRLRLRTGGLPRETTAGILTATHRRIIDGARTSAQCQGMVGNQP